MRITFVLPSTGEYPHGGAKVVYEYASGLVQRGHSVTVVHLPYHMWSGTSLTWKARRLISYLGRLSGATGTYRPQRWLSVDPRVSLRFVPTVADWLFPTADILVATAWQTAERLQHFAPALGRKFYLVHDYEHYMAAGAELRARIGATFRTGMHHIVTSPAGAAMVTECGGKVHSYIPNGIDFNLFALREPVDSPRRLSLGFPSRPESFKGTADAVSALCLVREVLGERLVVWTFGGEAPPGLPAWISFHQRPSNADLAALYNQSAVFIVPSYYEGWGLPGAEAMACGAALVSTENGGVRAYAEHEVNALLVPPKQPRALAEAILRLCKLPTLRLQLAVAGQRSIQRFTWSRAVDTFEESILK